MADFSMYGAESSLPMQMQRYAMGQAQTQVAQTQAQMLQQQQQDQAQMRGILANLGEAPGSPTERLDRAGDAAVRSGMLEQAEKAYQQSALIRQRDARALEYRALSEDKAAQTDLRKIQMFSTLLSLYPDTPEGFNAARTAYLGENTGEPSQIERQILQLPWREGMVDKLRQGLLGEKDRITAQLRGQELALKELSARQRERHERAQESLAAERLKVLKERNDRLSQAGGKAAPVPTAFQVKQARTMLEENTDPEAPWSDTVLSSFATELAAEAHNLRREDPTLSWYDALEQAYEDNRDRIQEASSGGIKTPFGTFGAKRSTTRTKGNSEVEASRAAQKAGKYLAVANAETLKGLITQGVLQKGDKFLGPDGKQYEVR